MANLTDRAERALLGAMITAPALTVQLSYLHPGDFTDPGRRAAYIAITRTPDPPETTTRQRSEIITATAGHPRVTAGYLEALRAACPDPGHGHAYAAMILQARLARQMTGRARELAGQSRVLAREARRATEAGAAGGPAAENLAGHLARVAGALSRHAHQIGAAPAGPAPAGTGHISGPRPAAQHETPVHGPAAAQQHREQRVLAALLHEHRDSARILSFLPAAAFTTQPRQELFQAIRTLHTAGKPVDELTADWELGPRATLCDNSGETYTTRLARTPTTTAPLLSDANTLMARLQRHATQNPAPAARQTRQNGQPRQAGQAAAAVPRILTPRPYTRLIQPPPDAIPAQPGPRHGS